MGHGVVLPLGRGARENVYFLRSHVDGLEAPSAFCEGACREEGNFSGDIVNARPLVKCGRGQLLVLGVLVVLKILTPRKALFYAVKKFFCTSNIPLLHQ